MRFFKSSACIVVSLSIAGVNAALAGDLGTIGPTYSIQEPDMLDWIETRVQAKVDSGEALRYQQMQAEKIRKKLENPDPLKSVSKTTNFPS